MEDSHLDQTFRRLAGITSEGHPDCGAFARSGPVHVTLLHANVGQLRLDLDLATEKLRQDLGAA